MLLLPCILQHFGGITTTDTTTTTTTAANATTRKRATTATTTTTNTRSVSKPISNTAANTLSKEERLLMVLMRVILYCTWGTKKRDVSNKLKESDVSAKPRFAFTFSGVSLTWCPLCCLNAETLRVLSFSRVALHQPYNSSRAYRIKPACP